MPLLQPLMNLLALFPLEGDLPSVLAGWHARLAAALLTAAAAAYAGERLKAPGLARVENCFFVVGVAFTAALAAGAGTALVATLGAAGGCLVVSRTWARCQTAVLARVAMPAPVAPSLAPAASRMPVAAVAEPTPQAPSPVLLAPRRVEALPRPHARPRHAAARRHLRHPVA